MKFDDKEIVDIEEPHNKIKITILDTDEKGNLKKEPLITWIFDLNKDKFCKTCNTFYPFFEFRRNKRTGLLYPKCKRCLKRERKIRNENTNVETKIKRKYKYFKKKNLYPPWGDWLTYKQFKSFITDRCYYCGKKPNPFNGIDRINNKKGYLRDNCVSCCWECNRMKGIMTQEEFNKKILTLYEWDKKIKGDR